MRCSSATRTSITRSTCRRSRGAPAATVYGSASLEHLMGLHGLAEQAVVVEPHRDYEVGPFRVSLRAERALASSSSGSASRTRGELTCEHLDELTPQAYRCGQVWGIHIEVAGDALLSPGLGRLRSRTRSRDRGVDVFLCGISGRRFTPQLRRAHRRARSQPQRDRADALRRLLPPARRADAVLVQRQPHRLRRRGAPRLARPAAVTLELAAS